MWETGLRTGTLARISVPEHYEPGRSALSVTDAIDKVRFGRELDKATEDKIKEILTSDQFAKLTPKPPANPNPWADMMPSEEEE
jgi:hypothetical protein